MRHSRKTKQGLRAARASGQLAGRSPELNRKQEEVVVESYLAGRYGASDLGELFDVSRSTVYRTLRRAERASTTTTDTNS